jgi:hypothetical protein
MCFAIKQTIAWSEVRGMRFVETTHHWTATETRRSAATERASVRGRFSFLRELEEGRESSGLEVPAALFSDRLLGLAPFGPTALA